MEEIFSGRQDTRIDVDLVEQLDRSWYVSQSCFLLTKENDGYWGVDWTASQLWTF